MKDENIRRIDLRTATTTGGVPGPSIIIQAGVGDANTLDGYDSSRNGTPNTIPVLDAFGKLPASVLPDGAEYAQGSSGIQYFGPTARLATGLAASDVYMEMTAKTLPLGTETAVLSRYGQEVEMVTVLGGAQDMGGGKWRYPIARGASSSKRQDWPKGTSVISLGPPNAGGFVVVNSASTTDASSRGLTGYPPYVATYANVAGAPQWRAQFGYLFGVPQAFKDLFVSVYEDEPIDWDSFGLAGENAFLSGGIYARYGSIAGDLDVTGNLTVYDANTPARVSFGQTPAGFGMSLADRNRRPIWTLAAAYLDEESGTYDSDTVWVVESQGERVIWLHNTSAAGGTAWELQFGPLIVARDLMTSRVEDTDGPHVVIRPDINSYRFGPWIVSNTVVSSNVPLTVYGRTTLSGELMHTGTTLGFFNVPPVAKPIVAGDRSDGTALVSLLDKLELLGLIYDNTVA